MNILLVAIGGLIGSMLRFFISEKANKRLIGTWIANITGSFLLAYLLSLKMNNQIPDFLWAFLGTGFCGAYTTFSTFGKETLTLLLGKKYGSALVYMGSTLAVSFILVLSILIIN